MTYTTQKLNGARLKVSISLTNNELQGYIAEAEKELAAELQLKGFRPGKVPRELAKDYLKKDIVAQKALDIALKQSLIDFLKKETVDVLNAEGLTIEQNNETGLRYVVTLTVYPELKLGEYLGVRINKKHTEISEQEIEDAIKELSNLRNKQGETSQIDDEFARNLGNFHDLQELRSSIRSGLKMEKEEKERARVRTVILKEIADSSEVEVPRVLVERQLDSMIREFDHTLHRNNMELSVYLAGQNKTEDGLRKEWEESALEKVKVSLILHEIAKREKIGVASEEIDFVMRDYLSSLKINPLPEATFDLEAMRENIRRLLVDEKVLSYLESKAEYY